MAYPDQINQALQMPWYMNPNPAPVPAEHRALPQSAGMFGRVADFIQNPARPERDVAFGGVGNLARQWSQNQPAGYTDFAAASLDMIPGVDDLMSKGVLAATAAGPAWMAQRMLKGGVDSGGVLGKQKGLIGGEKAAGADLDMLSIAQESAAKGMSRDRVFDATGWWQGKDGKWRFEIPDDPSQLTIPREQQYMPMQAMIDNPELYQHYPDMQDIVAKGAPLPGARGQYQQNPYHGRETITINPRYVKPDDKSTIAHETQHGIQSREGFSRGGSSEALKYLEITPAERERARAANEQLTELNNSLLYPHLRLLPDAERAKWLTMPQGDKNNLAAKIIKKIHGKEFADQYMQAARAANVDKSKKSGITAEQAYERLGGEVEARNVQARLGMTGDERRFRRPWTTQDVPIGQELTAPGVLSNPDAAMMSMADPKKTQQAYKLFRTDPRKPGNIYPLFVDANTPVPMQEWIEAQIGPQGKGGKVKSKIGELAFRPGWHSGDMPVATHIGQKSKPGITKPDVRPPNQVWAEVDVPADVDWQTVANERAQRTKAGLIIPRTAHITDQIPEGGFYRYKTNPNMTGDWLISGGLKVNRLLPHEEVLDINQRLGVADLPRIEDAFYGGLLAPPKPKRKRRRRK